jgi:hypothetical protein
MGNVTGFRGIWTRLVDRFAPLLEADPSQLDIMDGAPSGPPAAPESTPSSRSGAAGTPVTA